MRLRGKVAIVTGAARGIGATLACAFATEGARVVLFDREDATQVSERIVQTGGIATAVRGDVSEDADIARLIATAKNEFGRIDILVNNAAILQPLATPSFADVTLAEWDRILRVNLRGPFQLARAVVPVMQQQGHGRILSIGSSTVFMGAPLAPYAASKAGLISLTYALARELGPSGITANMISIGLIEGPSLEDQPAEAVAAARAMLMQMKGVKRDQPADSLIGAALFLCSGESDFVTGQNIMIDGGAVLH